LQTLEFLNAGQEKKMKHHRVKPGHRVNLEDHHSGDTGDYKSEPDPAERADELRQKLDALQERLYAEGTRAVLVVLQGIDTAGKDSAIRHVMSGINPQGCIVTSFKTPPPREEAHDFLWRAHAACPPRGYIGIFNRSHYEEVRITRVHDLITDKVAERRLQAIRDFEVALTNDGTRILKFLSHISKEEQKTRLLARVDDANKHCKISPADLGERQYWEAYQRVFEGRYLPPALKKLRGLSCQPITSGIAIS
jgi:PPK2 family polyphosphate:nucleotide phosphotransferase